ncbi:MAG: hypothetical protein K2Q18_07490, partial [Bdellovibrionales bacterium]|nr:hypothetical protein [Bdellovibrionales bacterium]
MRLLFIAIISSLIVSSCSHQETTSRTPQSLNDLFQNISSIEREITDPQIFNERNCSQYLSELEENINNLPSDFFYPKTSEEKIIMAQEGLDKYRELIQLRVSLQKTFSSFTNPSNECVIMQRRSLRYLRYITDSIIDYLMPDQKIASSELLFSGLGTQTIVEPSANSDIVNNRFIPRTGDVILMRGQTFVSSMIARNADEETGFAHLAIVVEDSIGKKYLMEALIETGVIITPFEEWMEKGREARLVAYRYKDSEVSKKAG